MLYFYTLMLIMFGPDWLLEKKVRELLLVMQREEVWQTMSSRDICSLIWGVHVRIRMHSVRERERLA